MAISSDVIRGYNDTMILYLLLDQPSYGYEISRQIKTLSHEKYIIKETTLYSAFTRMEKNGYITSFQDQNTATGKRRTYYQISGKGVLTIRKNVRNGCLRRSCRTVYQERGNGKWKLLEIIWKLCF